MEPMSGSASPMASRQGVAITFGAGSAADSPAANHEITPQMGELIEFTYLGRTVEMRYITKYAPNNVPHFVGLTQPDQIYKEYKQSAVRDIQKITEDTPISASKLQLLQGIADKLLKRELDYGTQAAAPSPRGADSPIESAAAAASTQSAGVSGATTPTMQSAAAAAAAAKPDDCCSGCCGENSKCTIM